jgi:hypothetical protein
MLQRRVSLDPFAGNALVSVDWGNSSLDRFVDQIDLRSVSHREAYGAKG